VSRSPLHGGKTGGRGSARDGVAAPHEKRKSRSTERVQKVLARAGIASRRQAEALIAAGRVRVGGKRVSEQGVQVDPGRDAVQVDGRRVVAEPLTYVLFHKPRQVMCTMRDPLGRKSVVDYLRGAGARVVPVGRLDYQTSGVLLLTNDGQLARQLAHPSGGVLKEYVLKVKGRVDESALQRFRDRIEVRGRKTSPASVRRLRADENNTWLLVNIHEGKNRQVRRLAEHAGYRVMRLTRTAFGGLTFDALRPGEWRYLSAAELRTLRGLGRAAVSPSEEEPSLEPMSREPRPPRRSTSARSDARPRKRTAR
jgi:23S rRNA pseudouridine2605 synthase